MHVVLIIIGGLFAAFGGGCTLIMLGLGVTDVSMFNDMGLLLSIFGAAWPAAPGYRNRTHPLGHPHWGARKVPHSRVSSEPPPQSPT